MKLAVVEKETDALRQHVRGGALTSSELAVVEVARGAGIAESTGLGRDRAAVVLASCRLVAVSSEVLRQAAELASASLRTLEAIHLASALLIQPDELVAYDRRLLDAAAAHGLAVASPGSAA